MPEPIERPDLGGPFPEHLAVIMDGNGRWAEQRGLRRVFGHREGVNSVRETVTECARMGVKSLTLYAFSVENWKRPRVEVRYLMRLLRRFLLDERATLMDNGVRLRGLGRLADLPGEARRTLEETERLTARNDGMLLRLALSYGSRTELGDAARSLARDVAAGRLDPEAIDDETLRGYLYDPETPDPDLVIRTAGELRLSNFLLWQCSYSELFVTDVCWPEFRKPQLLDALRAYAGRVRRFGGLIDDGPRTEASARQARAGRAS
ncbi:MAG: di-trans,poly-cis-decaprenylcistransferase [Planctomycetes bacterium]|nr:di-trans,poly-cis-decaprenylcistransferase [Planctomycetota bacterium]